MQNQNFAGDQELLCINTEKVYDWIVNEATFDINIIDEDLPAGLDCGDFDEDDVVCEVAPAAVDPIEILEREDRTFVIDGEEITLQVVTIRKNFVVTVFFETATGVEEVDLDLARSEQVILCAPDETDIEVTYTDLDCFVVAFECTPADTAVGATFDAVVSVRLCQSIQSTFPVTLELVADFCQPRDLLPFPPCPAPTIPPQCPAIFPANNDVGNGGTAGNGA
ncbi:hypothetical protein [Tenuibacillus multivorans]|uniref:SipL SPOCS domain-containing protein n=1 Tax=Tenuibacillus multivorans TaxID=237069 RepID=A0A1G9YN33_9BACI|nr:hypothetical protein [Tenuibacillus multivorans]GEL78479.1 hypothetical protein TMU01_27140 [Tenuibacillus multivorans]SDN10470.1 hypothetical protein SAMN05216498_1483 [Tenuibacillus multivorans]